VAKKEPEKRKLLGAVTYPRLVRLSRSTSRAIVLAFLFWHFNRRFVRKCRAWLRENDYVSPFSKSQKREARDYVCWQIGNPDKHRWRWFGTYAEIAAWTGLSRDQVRGVFRRLRSDADGGFRMRKGHGNSIRVIMTARFYFDFCRMVRQKTDGKKGNTYKVFVPACFVDLVGPTNAILLGNITHWFCESLVKQKLRQIDGKKYVWMNHAHMESTTGLTAKQIRKGLADLEEQGFLKRQHVRSPGMNKLYLRPVFVRLRKALSARVKEIDAKHPGKITGTDNYWLWMGNASPKEFRDDKKEDRRFRQSSTTFWKNADKQDKSAKNSKTKT
jgi:hypothetical protein